VDAVLQAILHLFRDLAKVCNVAGTELYTPYAVAFRPCATVAMDDAFADKRSEDAGHLVVFRLVLKWPDSRIRSMWPSNHSTEDGYSQNPSRSRGATAGSFAPHPLDFFELTQCIKRPVDLLTHAGRLCHETSRQHAATRKDEDGHDGSALWWQPGAVNDQDVCRPVVLLHVRIRPRS